MLLALSLSAIPSVTFFIAVVAVCLRTSQCDVNADTALSR